MHGRRGFTLIEMLVVVGIIIILTSLSFPAISKFVGAKKLENSARMVQSSFRNARRGAITTRDKNYLIFFRTEDEKRPGEFLFGMRRFRAGVGYEGESQFLLQGTQFDIDATTVGLDALVAGCLHGGIRTTVFEGLPSETELTVFDAQLEPMPAGGLSGTLRWIEFNEDGTLTILGGLDLMPYAHGAGHIFQRDVNVMDFALAEFDLIRDEVDMGVRGFGLAGVDERCFIDVDQNTGNVRLRNIKLSTP
jgi:prepilin-type N-terminal cleavage/methylation domain-containing protein